MPERCEAVAKNGKPCSATPVPGLGRCAWHAPEWAEQRRAWSREGGRQRSNANRAKKRVPPAMTAEGLQGLVAAVLAGVVAGRTPPAVGSCVASLARALIAVREATTLEERIGELERQAAAAGRGWGA